MSSGPGAQAAERPGDTMTNPVPARRLRGLGSHLVLVLLLVFERELQLGPEGERPALVQVKVLLETSATRGSWRVSPAVLTACAAASSHDVVLVPTISSHDFGMIAVRAAEQRHLRGFGLARHVLDAGPRGRQGRAGDAVMMAAQQQVH
jgi:hypothetical protein